MPNVDDHGLEVLKKAAVDIGDTPKKDYALQIKQVEALTVADGSKVIIADENDVPYSEANPLAINLKNIDPALVNATTGGLNSHITNTDAFPVPTMVRHKSEIVTGTGNALNAILYQGDVSLYSSIGIQATGTFSATISVYASNDNTNWVALNIQTNTLGTATISQTFNATNQLYYTAVNFKYIQFKITTYVSGTVNLTLFLTTSELDLPGAQVVGVAGAVQTIGYAAAWGTYSSSALNGVITPNVRYYNYSKVGLQVFGTFVATIIFEASNDNTNWFPIQVIDALSGEKVSSTSAPGFYYSPVHFTYFRAKITSYTSGTVSGNTVTNQSNSDLPTNEVKTKNDGDLVNLSFVHKKIHAGVAYSISKIFPAVANGSSVNFHIIPGASKTFHINFEAGTSAEAELRIYESPKLLTKGTSQNIVSLNRSNVTASTGVAYYGATYSSPGTLLREIRIHGGSGPFATGGTGGSPVKENSEFIFAKSTSYLVVLTNVSGSAQDMCMETGHYEL